MGRILQPLILLVTVSTTLQSEVKDPELPLCPTNVQYFPQELPMHCRMVRSPKSEAAPMPMPTFPPMFPTPPGGDKPLQFPPIPPGYNIPGAVFPGPPPGAVPMPMPMPMPMAMPMGMPQPPSAKLPVIVMPFYSPDPNYKRDEHKKKGRKEGRYLYYKEKGSRHSTPSWDTSDDCSDTDNADSDKDEYWKGFSEGRPSQRQRSHRHHRRRGGRRSGRRRNMDGSEGRELLTPVIQYVTRDGYVIYEKEISKGEAKDWLNIKKTDETDQKRLTDVEDLANQEQLEQEVEDNILKDKGKDLMERNPEIMLSQKPAPARNHRRKKMSRMPQQKTN